MEKEIVVSLLLIICCCYLFVNLVAFDFAIRYTIACLFNNTHANILVHTHTCKHTRTHIYIYIYIERKRKIHSCI